MSDSPSHDPPVTLSLSPAEQWTLHHVLLDRLDRESTASDPSQAEPPPLAVFRAFETLDAGDTTFTGSQLIAIQSVLAAYHHCPAWEGDRSRIEQLLHRVTDQVDQHQAALPADD